LPVGNDVVDLRDPANQPDALHPRFDRHVFADVELRALDTLPGEERHRERWMRWAAKEAAFKLIRQLEPGEPFHPRELVVAEVSRTAARVRVPVLERALRVSFDVDENRVHAIVTDPEGGAEGDRRAVSIRSGTHRRQSPIPTDAGTEVRRHAARSLAELFGLAAGDVEITAAGVDDRRPLAQSGGALLRADVSLSHDGRWLAWAVAKR